MFRHMQLRRSSTGSGESKQLLLRECNYVLADILLFSYDGVIYTLGIFVADTSALKNRGFMYAFTSSPYIITTWIAGPVATAFLQGAGFHWGFGTFAILSPVVAAPLIGLLFWNL